MASQATLPPTMNAYLACAIGSALGGVARFAVHQAVTLRLGWSAPWATLVVNVTGSFLIGFLAALSASGTYYPQGDFSRHFLMVGLLGGFTTFSTFSLQTVGLMRDGCWLLAGGNVAGSILACLCAAWLGQLAATAIFPAR